MVDLITRDSVINIISQCHLHFPDRIKVFDRIYGLPAVDAVPVVRCKDCKHWGKHDDVEVPGETDHVKACEWAFWMVGENGYCVYGERR